jgi:hypothetical protein
MTGKILSKRVLYSPGSKTDKMPPGDAKNIPGVLSDILVSDGSSIYLRQEKVFAEGLEDKPHLLATAGFRDDSWFNRTRWAVGTLVQSQLLVFDWQMAYGIQAYPGTARSNFFSPGGKGYLLFAGQWKTPQSDKPRRSGKKKKFKPLWAMRVPVRVNAMVLAGQNLFVAGPPDGVPGDDPSAALEGRKGAKLLALSAVDGTKLTEYELEHEPVFDGMAAGGGKLYIATTNGEILCLHRDK